jgi:hypothetical protein
MKMFSRPGGDPQPMKWFAGRQKTPQEFFCKSAILAEPTRPTGVWRSSAALQPAGRIMMDRLHFFTPVRIARGQGYPLEEVDSVSEAMVFLRKWPTGRRGPVYQCALNCCSAAMSGKMSAEEARKAFIGFARITRLLDDDMALPLSGASMDNVYALRR